MEEVPLYQKSSEKEVEEEEPEANGKINICFALTCFIIFGVGGCLILFAGFLPMALMNKSYQNGACYGAKGIYEPRHCATKVCNGCYQMCWDVYQGVSVIPNVTAYIWLGLWTDYNTVIQITQGHIGKYLGQCWYKNNGLDVTWNLYNANAMLIMGLAILVISLIVGFGIILKICRQKESYKNLISRITQCWRRKRGYTELGDNPFGNKDFV